MTREIKFRAWAEHRKQMYDNPCLYGENNEGINKLFSDIQTMKRCSGNEPHVKLILSQYTELKDKNGVEVFEGDIIDGRYGIGVVEYDNYYCGFSPFCGDLNSECGEVVKVIGNIWENPELLEAK